MQTYIDLVKGVEDDDDRVYLDIDDEKDDNQCQ